MPTDENLRPLAALHADQEIERLRMALTEAADYLERLPPVPETRRLAASLRERVRPKPAVGGHDPDWTREHGLLYYTVSGTPCGVRFIATEDHLAVEALVPAPAPARESLKVTVEVRDQARLDALIAYLCQVRRQRF